jgi:hypothetical protein
MLHNGVFHQKHVFGANCKTSIHRALARPRVGISNRDISQNRLLKPLMENFMVFPLILGVDVLSVSEHRHEARNLQTKI